MSVLLKEIRRFNLKAATELENAGIHTDSELQSLSRQDLSELFPAATNFQHRKTIFGIIHQRKPVDMLLEELQGFIPHDSLRDALSSNGILVDYLHVLKDMKSQVDNVQRFLEAHIGLLENINKTQPSPEPCKGSPVNHHHGETEATQHQTPKDFPKASRACGIGNMPPSGDHTHGRPHKAQASVKYNMLVTAQTFGAHVQLLNEIMGSSQELNLVQVDGQSSEDFQVIIVFCPIVSRPGTDIEAAMKTVRDDKPVILVLMHHSQVVRSSVSVRSWSDFSNVVLHVNVFYHEMVKGLIPCPQNQDAVSKMRQELLRHSNQGTRDAGSLNVSTYSGSTATGAGGYGNTRSRDEKQTGGFISSLFSGGFRS